MAKSPQIIINNLSFHLDQTAVQFHHINLTFEQLKYGIVGRNGVGKTTLLKLIKGGTKPSSGFVSRMAKIAEVPQSPPHALKGLTVGDALGVTETLSAMNRINSGGIDEADFEIVSDNWDIEDRIQKSLTFLKLWPIDLNSPFHLLSGGQQTKTLLAKTLIFQSDFLVLDEPTNNLDIQTREILYQFIENTSKGVILASHDRRLLNLCDKIIEITPKGVDCYGGNYDFYTQQKEITQLAAENEVHNRIESIKRYKKSAQRTLDARNKKESKGKKEQKKTNQSKIVLDRKKEGGETKRRRLNAEMSKKLDTMNQKLQAARDQVNEERGIDIHLSKHKVPNNKAIVQIEDLCFYYEKGIPLIEDVNLHLSGPGRVSISGPNGCGKSTLIKLIKGELTPVSGKITTGTDSVSHLDQNVSFLDPSKTVLDNFLLNNPDSKPFDAYSALASFSFRNKEAEKYVKALSGGERIRAGLSIALMSYSPPDLLILDEPTNHLDLASIEAIENALNLYKGAIIVVSHDANFLSNISISQTLDLTRRIK